MGNLFNRHPKTYGQGSHQCCVCFNRHGLIRKYGLEICRQCFRERATIIGFHKVIPLLILDYKVIFIDKIINV
uniref:40S ribosomal protein S29, putative n=1 Tax=Theileria parva TaxID=5875 RepID=Q4N5R8_THEPA|eukprot:XP_764788.1 40S ribosomal protein S29 [Theileria parva strain Muguga]